MLNVKFYYRGHTMSIIAAALLFVSCKPPEMPCSWSAGPMLIDGHREEWSNIPFNYFEKENVVMAMCNDSNNLYIMFSTNDLKWVRIITAGGLTLWLDSGGKKNKEFGIRFRGGPPPDSLMPSGRRFSDMGLPGPMDEHRIRGNELTIIDKRQNQEHDVPLDGSAGPAAGYAKLNDIFTYEFSVPFIKEDSAQVGINAGPNEKIAICAEWGGFDRKDKRDRKGGFPQIEITGGIPGGGIGNRDGGGMGHGPMRAFEKQEIWMTTTLSDMAN